ncbi:FtsX-like permease family protein [Dactylosporangium sp. NPDC048998]|uniref:FtsX-like permease family protein n=1 Tax=Dactylosporangium sp. NPDC048998 TaxID=3363976 RepID=UPI00371DE0B5
MLWLAWKTIRARKGGFLGAFIAVFCAATLITACGVLMESGVRAGVPTERYAAAAVVVAGKQSVRAEGGDVLEVEPVSEQPLVPEAVLAKVAAVPGVRQAVGAVSFPANVVGEQGPLTGPGGYPSLGHGWGSAVLAPMRLQAGAAPTGPSDVVLDLDLANRAGVTVGGSVRIAAGGKPAPYRVSGIATTAEGAGFHRQSALFFSDATARELSRHPGSFDAIGVLVQPGVDVGSLGLVGRVRKRLGGDDTGFVQRLETALQGTDSTVLTGADRSSAEFMDVNQTKTRLLAISGSFGGIAALIAIFVVAATLGLSIQQRYREFALMKAIAATPRQIRAMVAGEVLLLSVSAGLLGGVAGIGVAFELRDAFAWAKVIPADFDLALSPLPSLVAVLVTAGTARLSAAVVARRPSRIRPMAALGEAAVAPRGLGPIRVVAGVVLVIGGLVAAAVPLFLAGTAESTALTGISALAQVVGLALLGPKVVDTGVALLAGPLRMLSRIGGYLAVANTAANSRRIAAAVTPLMLAIGFALTFFFTQTTLAAASQRQADRAMTADFVVSGQFGGVPAGFTTDSRQVSGVAEITPVVRSQAILEFTGPSPRVQTVGAIGADPATATRTLDPKVAEGSFGALTGQTVALSAGEAAFLGVHVGDTVKLYLGDGTPVSLRLVATYTNNLGLGDVFLPHELAIAHTTDRADSQILVKAAPGADSDAVRAALAGVAQRYPGVVVQDRAAFTAGAQGQQETAFLVNLIALGVIMLYIAIAVTNTLVMTTAERIREFALLRLVGSTRRQVSRMMRYEVFIMLAIAIVVGSLIPIVPLALLSLALSGVPLPSGPPLVYLAVIGGAVALAYLAVALPTRSALNARPADAISVRS